MSSEAPFGLKTHPFRSGDAQEIWVETEAHRRALAHLRYGIRQGEGVVLISGAPGMGKSSLITRILDDGEPEGRKVIVLDGAAMMSDGIENAVRAAVAGEAGQSSNNAPLAEAVAAARPKGTSYALLIDNAHLLDDPSLDVIRTLSNLYEEGKALLQAALIGDPPLRNVLYRDDMAPLRKRVIASYHLPTFSVSDTAAYVKERLAQAGVTDTDLFAADALAALNEASGGVPREINRLAAASMDHATASGRPHITADDVAAARATPSAFDEAATITADTDLIIEPEMAEPFEAPSREAEVSVTEINQAIEQLQQQSAAGDDVASAAPGISPSANAAAKASLSAVAAKVAEREEQRSTKPAPPQRRPRGMSPQDLMMAPDPLRAASPAKQAEPTSVVQSEPEAPSIEETVRKDEATVAGKPRTLSPGAKAAGGLWDDAAPFEDEAEIARLKARPLEVNFPAEVERDVLREAMKAFIADSREHLTTLRESLARLRAETQALEQRSRMAREKTAERLEALQVRLAAIQNGTDDENSQGS